MAQNNAVPEACDCAKKWVTIGLILFSYYSHHYYNYYHNHYHHHHHHHCYYYYYNYYYYIISIIIIFIFFLSFLHNIRKTHSIGPLHQIFLVGFIFVCVFFLFAIFFGGRGVDVDNQCLKWLATLSIETISSTWLCLAHSYIVSGITIHI